MFKSYTKEVEELQTLNHLFLLSVAISHTQCVNSLLAHDVEMYVPSMIHTLPSIRWKKKPNQK